MAFKACSSASIKGETISRESNSPRLVKRNSLDFLLPSTEHNSIKPSRSIFFIAEFAVWAEMPH